MLLASGVGCVPFLASNAPKLIFKVAKAGYVTKKLGNVFS
jgi:hypothetical protein